MTDECRPHPPLCATITVGDAIVVKPVRERGGADPTLAEIERQLKTMLGINS